MTTGAVYGDKIYRFYIYSSDEKCYANPKSNIFILFLTFNISGWLISIFSALISLWQYATADKTYLIISAASDSMTLPIRTFSSYSSLASKSSVTKNILFLSSYTSNSLTILG